MPNSTQDTESSAGDSSKGVFEEARRAHRIALNVPKCLARDMDACIMATEDMFDVSKSIVQMFVKFKIEDSSWSEFGHPVALESSYSSETTY